MNVAFRNFNGQQDWAWINEQLPILRVEDTGGLIAYNKDTNERIGVCIWDNWTNNSVQCHLMINHIAALRHGFIELIADYVFNKKKKKFIYGFIPSNRPKALKINRHIGFTEMVNLKDGFADGVDYIVMQLKAENCPYLKVH